MKIPKLVILFFLISLGLKLVFGIASYKINGTKDYVDDWDYISYANQFIKQGISLPDPSKLKDERVGPGLGLILAILFTIFGEKYLVVIILNAILGAFITILIFYIGKNIFNYKIGIFASFLSITYVLYYKWIPHLLKEMWIFILFPLIIYLVFLESREKRITPKILLISFLFAFLIHIDERFLVYLPVIILILLILNLNTLKVSFMRSLAFLILVLALMVPWTLRNYQVYNRLVILTVRSDMVLNKFYKNRKNIEKRGFYYLTEEQIDSIAKGQATYNRNPLEIERIKRGVVPRKYSKWERWYNEFLEFWRPVRFNPGYVYSGYRFEYKSLRHNLAILLTYGVLLPFFFVGVYLTFKKKNIEGIIIFSILVFHTLIHVFLFWVRVRYRVPIDIFIITFASYGFLWVNKNLKSKLTHRLILY